MKISSHQVRAALEAYVNGHRHRASVASPSPAATGARPRVDDFEHRLKDLPDQRDTLVHDLRRKIRRGSYFVSSRDIVDALLGRLTADLLYLE